MNKLLVVTVVTVVTVDTEAAAHAGLQALRRHQRAGSRDGPGLGPDQGSADAMTA